MDISLLGGAFNPPHIGHQMIAAQVLDFTQTDEVWFLPNYDQSPPKPVAPVNDRLEMTKMMCFDRAFVSAIEIEHKLSGETIQIMSYLPPENNYHFIIGSDQLTSFHLWSHWQELLDKIPFYVFPRYGYPNEPLYKNMTVVSHPSLIASNISSTKIRERIASGFSIDQFVPKGVAEYIKEKRLYK